MSPVPACLCRWPRVHWGGGPGHEGAPKLRGEEEEQKTETTGAENQTTVDSRH